MAVYTSLNAADISTLFAGYGLGELTAFAPVSDGIENTTYFVSSAAQEYVLTVFEELRADDLPFFINLTTFLHEQQLPVAFPLCDTSGVALQQIHDKPALLFPRLPGSHVRKLDAAHCHAIGECLAKLHCAGQLYPVRQENPRGFAWMQQTIEKLSPVLPAGQLQLANRLLQQRQSMNTAELPRGIIHGDLFHDNVLFVGDAITGVIDFYNACTDVLLLDVAITVNDWCFNTDGKLAQNRYDALLAAYSTYRPLSAMEKALWPDMLALAAARFWLSRLLGKRFPRARSAGAGVKDPSEYLNKLQKHLSNPCFWP